VEPVILGPGEGETVTDEASSFVQIKADLPELAVTLSRYAPGHSGPGPHVHREHADCFAVLDGTLVFEAGPELERFEGGAGAFVLVPPNVVHTFRNESGADARFLNVHAPGAGFAEYLRAASAGDESARFDSHDPPPDGGRPASDAIVRAAGEGDELRMGPTRSLVRAGAGDDEGWVALLDSTLAPGFPGPVPHRHRAMVDSFFVLEGTLTLRAGDATVEAAAGSWASFPPGTVHTFSNPGEEPVRALNVMTPAGLEGYLREVAAEAGDGPPDPARMAELAARYDFEPAV
jgi:quercetin dioxygenase-like cupin family protein